MTTESKTVCVTGAGGFIGSHLVRELLDRGHQVRGTLRDKNDERKTAHLKKIAEGREDRLELYNGDLMKEGDFDEILKGCDLLCHAASPVYMTSKRPQEEIVDPALNGTRNVLEAASKSGSVKRVVLTSSISAITDETHDDDHVFTEEDWNLTSKVNKDPYPLSKSLAEKAAWEIQKRDKKFSMAVMNPAVVLGPVYCKMHTRSSPYFLKMMMTGKMPGTPRLHMPIVDVRDVAKAHIDALENPNIEGRFILLAGEMWIQEVAQFLAPRFPQCKIQTKNLPKIMLYFAAIFSKSISFSFVRRNVGRVRLLSNKRAQEVLGLKFRPLEETLEATGKSFQQIGLIS